MTKGRSIYFTEQEQQMLIEYVEAATEIMGEEEGTCQKVNKDMDNGLGSALKKLYRGRRGYSIYADY